ncbi:MAG: hypothetical protein ACE5HV_14930 [Acidobacteriota bacterium]
MRDAIHQQFGAAIDSLDGAIKACPDAAWTTGEPAPWVMRVDGLESVE